MAQISIAVRVLFAFSCDNTVPGRASGAGRVRAGIQKIRIRPSNFKRIDAAEDGSVLGFGTSVSGERIDRQHFDSAAGLKWCSNVERCASLCPCVGLLAGEHFCLGVHHRTCDAHAYCCDRLAGSAASLGRVANQETAIAGLAPANARIRNIAERLNWNK